MTQRYFYFIQLALFGLLTWQCNALASPQLSEMETDTQTKQQTDNDKSWLDRREESDSAALGDPFTISQHKFNYVLPVTYVKDPNPISFDVNETEEPKNVEAKYQISMKLPAYMSDNQKKGIYVGFTAVSFWQVYDDDASKPFRETNYEPEIFYAQQTNYRFLGIKFNQLQVGLNHQSNGQSGIKSRSWNRLFASALFSDKDSVYYFKAWYRIKEDSKVTPDSSVGDDNPDITHFLGHFELGYGKRIGNFSLYTLLRNNLKSDNKGSIELNLVYPLNERYDLLLQYFNGYGDSLIDYNRHQQRIGLGVQLTFL